MVPLFGFIFQICFSAMCLYGGKVHGLGVNVCVCVYVREFVHIMFEYSSRSFA